MKASEKMSLLMKGLSLKEINELDQELEAEKKADLEAEKQKVKEGEKKSASVTPEEFTAFMEKMNTFVDNYHKDNIDDVDTEGEEDELSSSEKADKLINDLFGRKEGK